MKWQEQGGGAGLSEHYIPTVRRSVQQAVKMGRGFILVARQYE
jgi:hypothetical protein